MKKNKIAAAYKNNVNNNTFIAEKALKIYQRMEIEKNLKLLPITDVNKLGVLYFCEDKDDIIRITFFDRTKTTSTFDVMKKAEEHRNDIVGEDTLFYPAELVGAAIVPNWEISSMFSGVITGTMNFDVFVKRMDM